MLTSIVAPAAVAENTETTPEWVENETLSEALLGEAPFALSADEPSLAAPLEERVAQACSRVAPLWPLKNFVAVNPFVGLTGQSFLETAVLMRRVAHHDVLMPADFYLEALGRGQIQFGDLAAALARWNAQTHENWLAQQTPDSLQNALSSLARDEKSAPVHSFADALDGARQSRWSAFVVEEIAKWCAAFYDQGQAAWKMPWRESLWSAWRDAARLDRNPEIAGLAGFRRFVSALPADASVFIETALRELGVPAEKSVDFLHRQLLSIRGWSGAVQFQVREKSLRGQSDESLVELLAIRLAYDLALFQNFARSDAALQNAWIEALGAPETPSAPHDLLVRAVFQSALENAYQRELGAQIKANNTSKTVSRAQNSPENRAAVQAVFCIDVRSEILRRALENADSGVETLGFAGFFGFAIEHVPFGHEAGSAQCPVLLTPGVRVGEKALDAAQAAAKLEKKRRAKNLGQAWKEFKTSALSSFSFVETAGLLSGVELVNHTLGLEGRRPKTDAVAMCLEAMPLETQIATAQGALRGMSLTGDFARVVLLCGHGSHTTNNPYGSGLDCGACGGHTGESNARVAAAVFNNPQVRDGLRERGLEIPNDTLFVAGLHNTTTDEVTLFDLENAPDSHAKDLEKLQLWLAQASAQTRHERAPRLGVSLEAAPQNGEKLKRATKSRANDWSQVRPEWGLANNAAFIAAPRERTKQLKLAGRSFLHSYDYRADADNAILSLIMNAPMVVASWINLQYYASTVCNSGFGAGTKTIHNLVGKMGVAAGNGGDLQVGLPLQSVHDGQKWMHEPLRLSVYLEAPRERIEAVIENSPAVRDLVCNDWLHVFSIENEGAAIFRYAGGAWQSA